MVIDVAGTYTVTLDVNATVNSLTLGGASGTQTLTSSAHTLTLNGASAINANGVMELSGSGQLAGSGDLTVNGVFNWNGGTISGSGAFTVNGTMSIGSGGYKYLDGRTITNQGTASVTGTETVYFRNGAVFDNQAGATFDVQTDVTLSHQTGATTSFDNAGTVRKSGGTGTATFALVFNNQGGTIDVQSGTIRLHMGGTHTGGTFTVASGASLEFSAYTHTFSGSYSGSGAGSPQLTGGTLEVDAGGVTFNFSGGGFEWTGGKITGGTLTNDGLFVIAGSSSKNLDGARITNRSTTNVTGTGTVYFKNDAVFDNQAGATFDVQTDVTLSYSSGTVTRFDNAGTVTKSGSGTAIINMTFNNGNTVNVNGGTLQLGGGGTHGSTFNVSAGGILKFAGGTHSLGDGSTFTGSGTSEITGGTVNSDGTGTGTVVNAGATLALSGGTLGGDGKMAVNGTFEWSGGTVKGNGSFTVNGSMDISGNGNKTLDGRTITNQGTASVTGTGTVYFRNGAVFDNQAGATFDVQTDLSLSHFLGATTSFNNAGTVRKSGGTGTATFALVFNNQGGTIDVQSGILNLSRGGTHTGSTFTVASGASLQFSAYTHTFSGSYSGSGSGSLQLTSGTLQVDAGGVIFNFSGGFEWTGGTISGGTLTNDGLFVIAGSSSKNLDGAKITNRSTANVTGAGTVYFKNGAELNNQGTFDIQVDVMLDYVIGDPVSFSNSGTVRKSGGSGEASLDFVLTNSGTVNVQSGTLRCDDDLTNNAGGVIEVASGANLTVNGTLTNNGELRQTKVVNGTSDVSFLDAGGYGGVIINAQGSDLDSTTVVIKGNQDCTNVSGETVKRCFDITPTNTTERDATITFYFANSELSGNSCDKLNAFHWNGSSWDYVYIDTMYGSSGRLCSSDPPSIRVREVSTFSPFVLKENTPTAVTLRYFTARPVAGVSRQAWSLVLLALGIGGLIAWRARRRAPA